MPARFVILLVVLLLFTVIPSALGLITEWFWFTEVDYTGIFFTTLTTKATLGGLVFLVALAGLVLNFRLALRTFTQPYMLFPGNGEIQPIVLNQKQLQLLGTAVAVLVSLFLGIFASSEWLTWLQFRNAVAFGQTDPLLGRDVSFYVFSLPFLDVLRYLILAVVVLSFIGASAVYVASGKLAVDPARGPVSLAGLGCLSRYTADLDDTSRHRPRGVVCRRRAAIPVVPSSDVRRADRGRTKRRIRPHAATPTGFHCRGALRIDFDRWQPRRSSVATSSRHPRRAAERSPVHHTQHRSDATSVRA